MNKDFAWELFKTTGNVDAYLMMRKFEDGEQITNDQKTFNSLGDKNGINKNEGNSNWRS
ncbi:MAG: YqzL family protein [Clostridia bacterium]|nr:YqzL family protein [Clostridia bacterium]